MATETKRVTGLDKNPLTVQELIDTLSELPKDAMVLMSSDPRSPNANGVLNAASYRSVRDIVKAREVAYEADAPAKTLVILYPAALRIEAA